MIEISVLSQRIADAERYLELLRQDLRSEWLLLRTDAEAQDDLPLALALIFPENWADLASQASIQGPRAFRTGVIYVTRLCSAADYWGIDCTSDTLREGVVADHTWPYGLGGPTLMSNILWLCRRHNATKGIDIHFYPWEMEWPDWLTHHLDLLGNLIEKSL